MCERRWNTRWGYAVRCKEQGVSGFTAPGSPRVSSVLLPPSPTRGLVKNRDLMQLLSFNKQLVRQRAHLQWKKVNSMHCKHALSPSSTMMPSREAASLLSPPAFYSHDHPQRSAVLSHCAAIAMGMCIVFGIMVMAGPGSHPTPSVTTHLLLGSRSAVISATTTAASATYRPWPASQAPQAATNAISPLSNPKEYVGGVFCCLATAHFLLIPGQCSVPAPWTSPVDVPRILCAWLNPMSGHPAGDFVHRPCAQNPQGGGGGHTKSLVYRPARKIPGGLTRKGGSAHIIPAHKFLAGWLESHVTACKNISKLGFQPVVLTKKVLLLVIVVGLYG